MGKYGRWGKHLELFEMYEGFRSSADVRAALLEGGDESLSEGSGSPEGRVDFPIFLQTVIRHRIRERFRSVASKWESYYGVENARDFREHTVSQLGAIRGIEGYGEHQEVPRLRTTEEPGPSFAVGKYGGIYGISYELVINDDTDQILNRIPREMGRSMAEYVSQTAAAFLESNPTYTPDGVAFFHASRANEVTGAAAELNETNLAAALDTMQLRRDSDGMPFEVTPRRVLVRNPSQKLQFDKIVRSQQTGVASEVTAAGAPDFAPGTYNALFNILPPDAAIQEPWLNDPNDWYLIGDVADRPAFVLAFLRNRRDPYLFLRDSGMRGLGGNGQDPYSMDFDEIAYKIRHVFGAAPGEPQAIMRFRP